MNFDYIKPYLDAVKPLIGQDVWVPCSSLSGWSSQIKMRPKEWTGVPFPLTTHPDPVELSWNRDPWIYDDPCNRGTVVKGKLAYVECSPKQLEKVKGTYQDPELGYFLHFKPTAEPKLTANINFLEYSKAMPAAPAGWVDTLSQQYTAKKMEADEQKKRGLW